MIRKRQAKYKISLIDRQIERLTKKLARLDAIIGQPHFAKLATVADKNVITWFRAQRTKRNNAASQLAALQIERERLAKLTNKRVEQA